MLSRVCGLRSLHGLKSSATGSSSVVSRRWASDSNKGGSVPASSSSSSGQYTPGKPYDGPVLKAWEQHPELSEYQLSNGSKNLMIGHQFVAHQPFNKGSKRQSAIWVLMMVFAIPIYIGAIIYGKTNFDVTPYPWWPLLIANLSQFDKDNYLKMNLDPSHYHQNFDESLEDPNAEEEEDEDEEDEDDE